MTNISVTLKSCKVIQKKKKIEKSQETSKHLVLTLEYMAFHDLYPNFSGKKTYKTKSISL